MNSTASKLKKSTPKSQKQKHVMKQEKLAAKVDYRKVDTSDTLKNMQLAEIAKVHVESFDSIFTSNLLQKAVQSLKSTLYTPNKVVMFLSDAVLGKPMYNPSETRQRAISYAGKFQVKLNITVDGKTTVYQRELGYLPVMIQSTKCLLHQQPPQELIARGEDAQEFGGYYITNGIERLIRLLIVPKRNHVFSLIRGSFQNRGAHYSEFGVQIRCVREDQTSQSLYLHYLTDGTVNLRFSFRKNEYIIPVCLVLRALVETNDLDLFAKITNSSTSTFLTDRVEMLLKSFKRYTATTRHGALSYLAKFAVMLDSPQDATQEEVGLEFLQTVILVHLKDSQSKFDLLIYMLQKLYGLVQGEYGADNPDALQFQECLLPGHLYLQIIKEKLADMLSNVKLVMMQEFKRAGHFDFNDRNSR